MTELLRAYAKLPFMARLYLGLINLIGVVGLGYFMIRGFGQML
jgi:hypothetical protein